MKDDALELVQSPAAIRGSLERFNAEAPSNIARAKRLLSSTTYWVFIADGQSFGPGKFVGLQDMGFAAYESALNRRVEGDPIFDGHRTRLAIEHALGGKFAERTDLIPKLKAWGEALVGADAFGNSETAKWRFIELTVSAGRRNPTWQRDELILALDLYFRIGRRVPDGSDPEVMALSELLNSLPIHAERPDQDGFAIQMGLFSNSPTFGRLNGRDMACHEVAEAIETSGKSFRVIPRGSGS